MGGGYRESGQSRMMPPWFADPRFGHFSNDPSLTPQQISTILAWVEVALQRAIRMTRRRPALDRRLEHRAAGFVLPMPKPVTIPEDGDVEYTYEIVPTHFTEDKWIQMAEVHPSSPQYVHHAVVYIRPPDSKWLRHAPVGVPFTASTLSDPQDRLEAHGTTSDLLLVYARAARRTTGRTAWRSSFRRDQTWFFRSTTPPTARREATGQASDWCSRRRLPRQRVLTLQLNDHAFIIPPGADDFRVEVQGTLPHDATLLSLFPHMHLRGKRFEYDIVKPDGSIETLLRVNYHFHWQLSYRLAEPLTAEGWNQAAGRGLVRQLAQQSAQS